MCKINRLLTCLAVVVPALCFPAGAAPLEPEGRDEATMAASAATAAASKGSVVDPNGVVVDIAPASFGDLAQDLVYTPIQPCRIIDTRNTAAGALAANANRSFVAISASNFTSQGGSATNCGTLGLSATAVAVNFTIVSPVSGGYLTIYPFGTAMPLAATVNYLGTDIVRGNFAIVKIPNPLSSFDFTVFAASSVHLVGDIVGYFAPPLATALQCVETANTDLVIPASGTGNVTAPACATSYTQTATNCETTSWLMPLVYFQSGTCSARNNSTGSETLRASRTCCRVPGR